MSEKTAVAYLKSVKSSPLKVVKVANGVRNMSVSRALDVLRFSKLKLAPVIRSLVYSAMSNAENNHDMDIDNLYIKRIDIGKAFTLKRFHTRGRGKSSRILKTFSNIRVVLAEREEEVVEKKAKDTKNKSSTSAKKDAAAKVDNKSKKQAEKKPVTKKEDSVKKSSKGNSEESSDQPIAEKVEEKKNNTKGE